MIQNKWQIAILNTCPRKGYFYIQEFLKGNDFNTRLTIIGKRAFVFRRHNRPGDFRDSGSGLLDYDMNLIGENIIKMAFEIASRIKSQSTAFDILLNEKKICNKRGQLLLSS